MKITSTRLILAATTLLFFSGYKVMAAQVSYDFGSKTIALAPTDRNASTFFDVPLFDSSLGTLTGATFTFYEAYDFNLGVINNSPVSSNSSFSPAGFFYWQSATFPELEGNLIGSRNQPYEEYDLEFSTGTIPVASGTSFSNVYFIDREVDVVMNNALAGFLGGSSDTFRLHGTATYERNQKDPLPGITYSMSYDTYLHGVVTYTFTPVPEPSSLLVAATAGLLAALHRRRKY